MTLTPHVIADLEWVIAYWPDLTESRLPGTARPWRQPELTPEQRAERDHAARIEKADRSDDAWGETPAPVDVGVLVLITDLTAEADRLTDLVAAELEAEKTRPEVPATGVADIGPMLDFVAKNLAYADLLSAGELLPEVARTARIMVDQIARALCLVYDGQRLDVECPWCEGRTELAPVGGEKTWRVRELPGGLVAIVCESGTCEPPTADVGTWWRGKPCWPTWDWEFLAKRVTPEVAAVLRGAKVALRPEEGDELHAMDSATTALLSGVLSEDLEEAAS